MDIGWKQNPPSKLNVALGGEPWPEELVSLSKIILRLSPNCVAVVQIVFVRVQEDVGMNHHGVGRLLKVSNDRPVVMLSEYHPEPRLDQVKHHVRGVPSAKKLASVTVL